MPRALHAPAVLSVLLFARLTQASDDTPPKKVFVAKPACEAGPWTSEKWREAVATEMQAQGIEVGRGPGSATVTLLPADCDNEDLGVTLVVTGMGAARRREMSLRDLKVNARPRAVAIAIGELIRGESAANEVPPPLPAVPAITVESGSAPKRTVRVHFEADNPAATIEVGKQTRNQTVVISRYGSYTDDGMSWYTKCRTPCGIDLEVGERYRVGGPDVTPSREFLLPDDAPTTRVHAKAGRHSKVIFGFVGGTLGVIATVAGAVMIPVGFGNENPGLGTAGVVSLGAGIGLTIGGVLMASSNFTSVDRDGARVARLLTPFRF